ncbi:2-succinyl-6-hydroxy-2,4-cyclohexadiene-1-carboxylate synthase [Planococcus salinarum]|uniref:2-succinyl-6-hydroxy-2, 4-cyclohexadiene-1-carboxylate synthase n=1 Tax=Planococcus salinarum TaxID=622695 RepID=UPI000E3BC9F3|nr:2-succinyl-6-hydroxy-2,4-cyclohexadiene-1-carboxylate synthase [Planococcus salinarum]TAA69805.1 2-succinyl-6-hydroxy-2,4-cyclohexadiene-1-carboxylate synthase [Planococcus salinarum]
MKLEIEGVNYHIEILNEDKEQTLVFLHGFTGSTVTWHNLVSHFTDYKIILLDLLGHGLTESPENPERYAMELQLRDLEMLFGRMGLEEFALAGYSMGGRAALAYACTFPGRVSVLVLESASPGLKSGAERSDRRQSDGELAERIVSGGTESFVKSWEKTPLFSTQESLPDPVKIAVREERMAQNPIGLANSLIGMGTGAQESYWEALCRLKIPVLLLTGSLDDKFTAIAKEMVSLMPEAVHQEILAGHALHVEKSDEFATIVREYLKLNY